MKDRDCMTCIHKHPNGMCGSWNCEYINREEAIKAYRAYKEGKDEEKHE